MVIGFIDPRSKEITICSNIREAYECCEENGILIIDDKKTTKPSYSKLSLWIQELNKMPKHSEKAIILRGKIREETSTMLDWENKYLRGM